jgi:hypothetical protein
VTSLGFPWSLGLDRNPSAHILGPGPVPFRQGRKSTLAYDLGRWVPDD